MCVCRVVKAANTSQFHVASGVVSNVQIVTRGVREKWERERESGKFRRIVALVLLRDVGPYWVANTMERVSE